MGQFSFLNQWLVVDICANRSITLDVDAILEFWLCTADKYKLTASIIHYMSYPEVLLLLHFRTKMTKMNIFRAADQIWGSSVENLYPYTILHLLTYEKPHIKTISILGHSDHHTDIVIELALKFDAICIYICTHWRNYHMRLLWSLNRYRDWIHTEIWWHLHIHVYSF